MCILYEKNIFIQFLLKFAEKNDYNIICKRSNIIIMMMIKGILYID